MNDKIPIKDVTPVKIEKPAEVTKPSYAARSRIYVRSVKGIFENFRRIFGFIFIAAFAILAGTP